MNRLKEPDSDGGKIKRVNWGEVGIQESVGYTRCRLHETSSTRDVVFPARGDERKRTSRELSKGGGGSDESYHHHRKPFLPSFTRRHSTHRHVSFTDKHSHRHLYTPTKIQKQEHTSATGPSYHHPSVVQLLLLYYCRATRR